MECSRRPDGNRMPQGPYRMMEKRPGMACMKQAGQAPPDSRHRSPLRNAMATACVLFAAPSFCIAFEV